MVGVPFGPYGEPQPDPSVRDHLGRQEVVLLAGASGDGAARAVHGTGGLREEVALQPSRIGAVVHEGERQGGRHLDQAAEVVPGYTRAVGIVQPVVVAHREDRAPDGVEFVPVAPDAEPTVFSVFIERPGANMNGWPGKNANRPVFVGRIPLAADAGTCCIVAVQAPLAPGRVELPRPSDDELRHVREWAVNGVLVTTIFGEMSDGAIALIDLWADSSVGTSIDSALS
jgi:hypothetical protein